MKKLTGVLITTVFALAGCASSGNSYEPAGNGTGTEQPAPEPAPESKPQPGTEPGPQPGTEPGKEPGTEPEPGPASDTLSLDDRKIRVVPSLEGGDVFLPVRNKEAGLGQYMSGPIHYNSSASTFDNKSLADHPDVANVLRSGEKIDPAQVQHLELTGPDGNVLGRFQFVNQNYSSYGQFMAAFNASPYTNIPEDIPNEALAFYVAQPTTIEQFNQQSGTATYTGHVLGYLDGVNGTTPHQEAVATVNFDVDFAEKMISGRVVGDTRFDGLVKYNWRYTDDDDQPTQRGMELSRVDLILKPTKIVQLNDGTVGFGVVPDTAGDASPRAQTGNVTIVDNGTEREISQYGGIFAGPRADEVVGQIGGGEDRLIFGATRNP